MRYSLFLTARFILRVDEKVNDSVFSFSFTLIV